MEKKSRRDLDPGPTMPKIELVRVIFIYCNVFKFHVLRSISFELSHKNTETHTHTHTDTHRDSDQYSIVAFSKPQL